MTSAIGRIVDVDVHHWWKSQDEIISYLPHRWQDYYAHSSTEPLSIVPPIPTPTALLGETNRRDAYSSAGDKPGTDLTTLQEQLLDRHDYYRALLTHNVGDQPAHANQELATALCLAINDWTLDRWVAEDERLYMSILVPTATPDEAAKEIRRLGGHPRVASVLFSPSPLNRPLGDPVYRPIWAAAAEMGISVSLHPTGTDYGGTKMLAGTATNALDYLVAFPAAAAHYISSMIVHGVFEQFRGLKVVVKEFGLAWLPGLVWRLDSNYKILQAESAWVKRWPQEYVVEHFRFATQPIEEPNRTGDLWKVLSTIDGIEEMLCFSSDYPHFTADEPSFVGRAFPREWHDKIFRENACNLYGWPTPEVELQPA